RSVRTVAQQPAHDDAGSSIKSKHFRKEKSKSTRRVPVTALMAWPSFHREGGNIEVDNQVAAPAETRTPNWHRAKQSLNEECGWKGGDSGDSVGEKTLSNEKTKEPT